MKVLQEKGPITSDSVEEYDGHRPWEPHRKRDRVSAMEAGTMDEASASSRPGSARSAFCSTERMEHSFLYSSLICRGMTYETASFPEHRVGYFLNSMGLSQISQEKLNSF